MIRQNANFSFQDIALAEDTHFVGCNLTLARIARNGFTATFEDCNRNGLYLDGVKQDAYVWRRMGRWATADAIRDALDSGGWDAVNAFTLAVTIIQTGSASMTWTQFQTAYSAQVGDNCTYSTILFEKIKKAVAPGAAWATIRDFIRSHSLARLTGEDTEILEERS